ncbi:hypothetical protein [Microseira wollei]|uniref:hypothetical protein n=1 Tax=Microseira wollei TaxID=467598 RepID=UPI001CFCEA2E|nr:hypothetical protein [Microseira wollei]
MTKLTRVRDTASEKLGVGDKTYCGCGTRHPKNWELVTKLTAGEGHGMGKTGSW